MAVPAVATIIWHRRDLRLADNELYADVASVGAQSAAPLVPVFVVDPCDFAPGPSCVPQAPHQVARVGPFACRFLLECLEDLRRSLRGRRSELYVRVGRPGEALPALVDELRAQGWNGAIRAVWHDEAGSYEESEARQVRAALERAGVSCASRFGCAMWHPGDLPSTAAGWGVGQKGRGKGKTVKEERKHTGSSAVVEAECSGPAWEILSQLGVQSFRRKAKATTRIREPYAEPAMLPAPVDKLAPGNVPSLSELLGPACESSVFGLSIDEVRGLVQAAAAGPDKRSSYPLPGGESAARLRLASFVSGAAGSVSRDGGGGFDVGVDSSSKLSAYLAFGCLSPRAIVAAYKSRADGRAEWLAEQLEMRDFWIHCARAQGSALFNRDNDGTNPAALAASHWQPCRPQVWRRWATGSTGLPVMDAAMSELLATGFTSNRPRQICVSFLARDMAFDWRLGAEYFQWLLVDHDVGSNWGNWRYFAGVGCDPKQRYYCSISQGLRYDPDASFVRLWLPALRSLSAKEAHLVALPGRRSSALLAEPWPEAAIDPMGHISFQDKKLLGPAGSAVQARADDWPRQAHAAGRGGKAGGGKTGGGYRDKSAMASLVGVADPDASCAAGSGGGGSSRGAATKGRRWQPRGGPVDHAGLGA
uniref:Photolyase/cryptochrome alpha/beta domain-containing protein n=1 Tax=Zooxanthella nutricula TaxID=1333877 RepID=A0A6U6UNR9_9DINO|mmetsp:Transcript_85561/g.261690  ORF Transcript_85561/g.261690 Transcript_85561/m.261690 type:complete len:648 (+) Transcript_85561:64-2007(+)